MEIDFRELALDGLAYSKAHEDMGVYCKSVSGGANPYTERTPYMEGWNAFSSELHQKASKISGWLEKLPAEIKVSIEDFLLGDKLQIHVHNDEVSLSVNCNDLFYWASADGENFSLEDLSDFKKAFEESPKYGDILWCCRKRAMRPQTPYYKYFDDSDKILFNACGAERTDA